MSNSTKPNHHSLDFSHCFKKQFTKAIYNKLLNGDSINLTGNRHNGQKRLFDDIRALGEQQGLKTLIIDMNSCKYSYEGFLELVRAQLDKTTPSTSQKALPEGDSSQSSIALSKIDIAQVITQTDKTYERHLLLLLNYDALLNNKKQRFPKAFFDNLNSLKNKKNVSLCCVTERPHLQYKVYYNDAEGSIIDTTSWLDLNILENEKPTLSEIRDELNKKLERSIRWEEEQQKEIFVDAIKEHTGGYAFMEMIINSFSISQEIIPSEKRLKKCYRKYGESFGARPKKVTWFSLYNVKSFLDYCINSYAKIKGKSK